MGWFVVGWGRVVGWLAGWLGRGGAGQEMGQGSVRWVMKV